MHVTIPLQDIKKNNKHNKSLIISLSIELNVK
jgi:hypothetical protein